MNVGDREILLVRLERALDVTGRLIGGIRPDQWEAPTPCEGFDVQGLTRHLVGGVEGFAKVAEGRATTFEEPSVSLDQALDAFRSASARAVAGWAAPGTLDKVYDMPWGETPGRALAGFLLMEEVTHGWDLGRATGQVLDFDDELVGAAFELARRYDDSSIRVPKMFGPAVAVSAQAPLIDQLAGFLGRDPERWGAHR